jgi:hypothetical protein
LKEDPTYFSEIEGQVHSVAENLITLPESDCPQHIDLRDLSRFKTFYASQYLVCRIIECRRSSEGFDSLKARNDHEATHTRSFTCLKCDGAMFDFSTRKALDRHNEVHHMQPEDYQIPEGLDEDVVTKQTALQVSGLVIWNYMNVRIVLIFFYCSAGSSVRKCLSGRG